MASRISPADIFAFLLKRFHTKGIAPAAFIPKQIFTRRLWLKAHLYLALSVGLIFAILGLTGSLLIYQEQLDEWLNPELVIEHAPSAKYQSLDKIMAAVKAEHPKRYGEWTLELPSGPHGMMTAWFEKPRETFFERYAPLMVSVNPYTAEVVASRFWGRTAVTWLADLHTQLLLGDTGWNLVGACGILLAISALTGLYLWWPGIRQLPTTFRIKIRNGWMVLLYDSHSLLGLLCATGLLVLAFTGFNLSFPGILESLAGTSGMAHGETGKSIVSTASPNNHPTGLEAAEFVARSPFPTAQLRRVTTPDGNSGVYRVNLRQKFEVNRRHPFTTVWIDRWSGQIREVRDPKGFTGGEKLITWIWPLHTAEALGETGRFFWFLSGQCLFFLYVSGMVRWLHKKGVIQDSSVELKGLRWCFVKVKAGAVRGGGVIAQWMKHFLLRGLAYLKTKVQPWMQTWLKKWLQKMKQQANDQPKDWF
jgi:uncharacterized iron-regulated membrane protein